MHSLSSNLAERARQCIVACDIDDKLAQVQRLAQDWYERKLIISADYKVEDIVHPGMPDQLILVHPSKVKRRRLGTPQGRVALLHAIAHIEFSAINLALDAIYHFKHMPDAYYEDWLRIACEECYHFSLIRCLLQDMGHEYGDLPAHQGLWDVALYSATDVLQRMAIVPRVLEARGLDVTPGMIERVRQVNDHRLADILKIILRDEVGHVAAGSYWFRQLCKDRRLDPDSTFDDILNQYKIDMNAHIKGPFHVAARQAAGFSQQELNQLSSMEPAL